MLSQCDPHAWLLLLQKSSLHYVWTLGVSITVWMWVSYYFMSANVLFSYCLLCLFHWEKLFFLIERVCNVFIQYNILQLSMFVHFIQWSAGITSEMTCTNTLTHNCLLCHFMLQNVNCESENISLIRNNFL